MGNFKFTKDQHVRIVVHGYLPGEGIVKERGFNDQKHVNVYWVVFKWDDRDSGLWFKESELQPFEEPKCVP